MPARNVILLTPSGSLRPSQALSCTQITHACPEQRTPTPLIPFFVFKSLRTLSFSVSRKSCVCRSYENGRVCTNNSHSATPRCAPANLPLNQVGWWRPSFLPLCALWVLCDRRLPRPGRGVKSFFFSRLSTLDSRPPHPLSPFFSNSCGLFCAQQKLNSFLFKQFRTLSQKHPGWDSPPFVKRSAKGAYPSGGLPSAVIKAWGALNHDGG